MMHPLAASSTEVPQDETLAAENEKYYNNRSFDDEENEESRPNSFTSHSVEDRFTEKPKFRGDKGESEIPPRSRSLDGPTGLVQAEQGNLAANLVPVPMAEACRSVSGYIENGEHFVQNLPNPSPVDGSASLYNVLSCDGEIFANTLKSSAEGPCNSARKESDLDSIIESVSNNGENGAKNGSTSTPSVSTPSANLESSEILEIRVDRPQKILTTMDTYVTFRVWTKIKHSSCSAETEYEVHRRFSDFAWLRQRLEQENPMTLFPPLPEKHSVYSLDRFDPNFIRARCFLLHLFMQGLLKHPKIQNMEEFWIFITWDLQTWVPHRKKHDISRLGALYHHLATTRLTTTTDSEFLSHSERCNDLGMTLAALEKMLIKWNQSECSAEEDMSKIQVVLEHWAEYEENARLKEAVSAVQEAVEVDGGSLGELTSGFEAKLALPLRHWSLYAEAVKQVLRRRDGIHYEQVAAREALKKKLSDKESFSPQQSAKEVKAKQHMEELEQKSKRWDENLRDSNSTLRKELDGWQRRKECSLMGILREMALERAEYHRKSLEAWEKSLAVLSTEMDKCSGSSLRNGI